MFILFILIAGQAVFAVAVIFVLKKLLDRELMNSALEQFESSKISPEAREITVRFSSPVSDEFRDRLESVRKRKFAQAHLNFEKDPALKGGVVIAAEGLLLDFSLSNRLRHFWS